MFSKHFRVLHGAVEGNSEGASSEVLENTAQECDERDCSRRTYSFFAVRYGVVKSERSMDVRGILSRST